MSARIWLAACTLAGSCRAINGDGLQLASPGMARMTAAARREDGSAGGAVVLGAASLLIGVAPPNDWKLLYWLLCTAPSLAGLLVLLCMRRRKQ